MGLRINQNTAAMNAYRNLSVTDAQMSKSLEKLSSGFRINRAADDAAGLAISEGLRSQIGGLKVAVRNTQDGVSVVQTAEGALTETHSILQRMRDLAVQSANDSNDTNSRTAIDAEATALKSELNRISDKTTFNNVKLLDGQYTGKQFQVGYAASDTIQVDVTANAAQGVKATYANGAVSTTAATATLEVGGVTITTGTLTASSNANTVATQLNADKAFSSVFTAKVTSTGGLEIKANNATLADTNITITGAGLAGTKTDAANTVAAGGFSSTDLGVGAINLATQAGANNAISAIDTAITAVSTSRANLGALQNRFEHTINNLNVAVENLSASESRIRDTDMAQEMVAFTRSQILSQAGTAMLAQANQAPQSVLRLLQ
ncbi:MAG: flagellin [Nocardioidaceae bacterium]|nr:flagellin [Nocardioidaceae bacterium]